MIDFISIFTENTRNGKESKTVLLPIEKTPANLVNYLKKKFRLNDKMFEELLKENDIDAVDHRGGELEIKNYIVTWGPTKAVRKSTIGKYTGVFFDYFISESDNHHESILLPIEEMPQAFFSYIKENVDVSEYEIYYDFFRYYGFCGKARFPKEGQLKFEGKDFMWFEAMELDSTS